MILRKDRVFEKMLVYDCLCYDLIFETCVYLTLTRKQYQGTTRNNVMQICYKALYAVAKNVFFSENFVIARYSLIILFTFLSI